MPREEFERVARAMWAGNSGRSAETFHMKRQNDQFDQNDQIGLNT